MTVRDGIEGQAAGIPTCADRRLSWLPEPRVVLAVVLALLIGALTVVPLATVVVGSFRPMGFVGGEGFTLEHYAQVWGSAHTWDLIANTLVFAAGSTFIAILIGLPLAWLLERSDFPGRDFFAAAILVPMIVPPLLLAIGWVLIMSPRIGVIPLALKPVLGSWAAWLDIYGMGGMMFVQALAYIPTTVLMFGPVVRNMDPAYEQAAIISGASVVQTIARISLPFLLPSILSVATILMIVGTLAFDVPAVIGMPAKVAVMSEEIYLYMNPPNGIPEYGASAALNSSLFILLTVALIAYLRLTAHAARFATISGKGYRSERLQLGRWRWWATAFVAAYFLMAVAMPFLALVWASLVPYYTGFDAALLSRATPAAYVEMFANPRLWRAAGNAAVIAITAAVGVTALSLAASWLILRSRVRFAFVLDILSMVPIGVPHLMMGVALIFVFFSFKAVPLYGTIWLIALGHLVAYLPVASRMMQAGLLQIGRELEEAAMMSGGSVMQGMRRIVMPLLKPTLIAIMIWIAVHSLREFSIAVMLQSGKNEVISTILFSLWDTGKPDRAAAVAVVLMLCLGALIGMSNLLLRDRSAR
jgi:iron(III) transport system permease protein